jgi:hypothetical protein
LLISDPNSSPSPIGMLDPIIPFSSTILDPSAISFFFTTIGL